MANILTAAEAANVLRCAVNDPAMLDLLPSVDAYIKRATGRDWAADTTIWPEAKSAARMLITMWHENPAMIGQGVTGLAYGLPAALAQLEALALELETAGVPDEALTLAASSPADGATEISIVTNITLIFNHEMDAGATAAVTLADGSGAAVAAVNSLDTTKRILTVNPNANLTAATRYVATITAAADVYGQTVTDTIQFTTA